MRRRCRRFCHGCCRWVRGREEGLGAKEGFGGGGGICFSSAKLFLEFKNENDNESDAFFSEGC